MKRMDKNESLTRRIFIKSVAAIAATISAPDIEQGVSSNPEQKNLKGFQFPAAPPDLKSNVPPDFPRFVFPESDHQAQLINDYL